MIPKISNFYLYQAVFCVNLLSISTSSVFSWSSPSIPILTSSDPTVNPLGRPIDSFEESCIATIPTFGAIVGIFLSGYAAEKLGRKKTLIIFSVPFIVCFAALANATDIYLFYVTRFILGVSAGCVVNVIPSYVGEISEDSNRGVLGSIFGVMNNFGHLLCFGVGPLLTMRMFAYVLIVPVSLFFFTFVFFAPETPHYFVSKDDIDSAKSSLRKIRKGTSIEKELDNLIRIENDSKNKKVTWKNIASSSAAKRGLLVACGLFTFQPIMGIPFMLNYLQPILISSGSFLPVSTASLIIGFVQLISCAVSAFLIDRLGRKTLIHVSSTGCSISVFSLGLYFRLKDDAYDVDSLFWLPLASILSFYMFFNVGYGSVPWMMCGELFATNVKSLCVTISTSLCLFLGFLVAASFPFVRDAFGLGEVFMVFGVLAGLTCIFVQLIVPETKGRSFEDIQMMLNGKK